MSLGLDPLPPPHRHAFCCYNKEGVFLYKLNPEDFEHYSTTDDFKDKVVYASCWHYGCGWHYCYGAYACAAVRPQAAVREDGPVRPLHVRSRL